MDRILVVVPTYNEKENIVNLCDALLKTGDSIDVLVVDDGSPDGTSTLVRSHPQFGSRVLLMERSGKAGRGSACIAGFKFAFEKGVYDYIVEMDADFSHDPRDLPSLLAKAPDADVVIGSRYVRGSKVSGWNLRRTVLSKLANVYAKLLLRIPIKDYTTGYRCYRASELAKLPFDRFKSSGYITLSEISYNLYRNGCTFAEVPVTFVDRRRGTSNMSLGEMKEAFLLLPRIRFTSSR